MSGITEPKQSANPPGPRQTNQPAPPSGGGDSPLKNILLGLFLTAIGGFLLAVSHRPKGIGIGVLGIVVGPIMLIVGLVGLAKKK